MRDPFQASARRGEIMQRVAARFPDLDTSAIEAHAVLESTAEALNSSVFAPLAERGISRGRFTVMMHLAMNEALGNEDPSPSAIAESLGVTRATMTQLLDGLEKDGLVVRRNAANDRRSQTIYMTAAGRALFDELIPPISQNIARAFEPLAEGERRTLTKLLMKLKPQRR